MKLKSVEIENYRAIEKLKLSLDPSLTVLHGDNGYGKTSVLSAISVGLGHEDMLGSYLDISTIDLCKEDWREGKGYPRVVVEDTNGNIGERRGDEVADELKERNRIARKETMQPLLDKALATEDKELPIVAFYGTERTFSDMPDRVLSQRGLQFEPSRRAALEEALSARTDFKGFLAWFSFKEHEELRRLKYQLDSNYQLEDLDYHLKDLSAVRQAISSMLPEVSEPRTESNPSRFVVSHKSEQGQVEKLSLDQLSGGYRIVLALAADLARRMAQGNPHLDDPLKSEAVVLIDEVELHLHPAWQQRILGDLQRTFPALPSLTNVLVDGRIEVDKEACEKAGIPIAYVTRTIEILNLNARRLRLAREAWRKELVKLSRKVADPDDPSKMEVWHAPC